ncbi:hypothetical protein [Jonesia quinghaiensis]|uniref:hypothetical protein n=1 Tax=Jonesia quinghaiensis TaxID=262806 RepID=UPI00040A829D|nr:hypothetical protein [Jonesia quinghaiensis]
MYSLFNRLVSDISRTIGLLLSLGATTFVMATLGTYLAIFANEYVITTRLDGQQPAAELAFLRVIDPQASMLSSLNVDNGDESGSGDDAGLTFGAADANAPGVPLLLDRMVTDPRLTIAGPIDRFGLTPTNYFPDPQGVVIVGADPPDAGTDTYIQGTGHVIPTRGKAVYQVTPEVFDSVFDARTLAPGELMSTVTCRCGVIELQNIADKMTLAEQVAETGRVYYALGYQDIRGEESFYRVSSSVWNLVLSVAVIAVFAGMVVSLCQRIWGLHKLPCRIDRLNGASHGALQARFHVQILFAFTLPAVGGFLLVNIGVGSTGFPPAFTENATRAIIAGLLAVHIIASLPATVAIRRMCNYSHGILR